MISGKTILISALDWGLGHATRCVPLIRSLEKNNSIIIGVTPLTKGVFDSEFPHLQKTEVPAYNISYSRILPLWLKLFTKWPSIVHTINEEHKLVTGLVKKHGIDMVISDNRFGFYSQSVHSVFITHQLFLQTPFGAALAQKINRRYILQFKEVWVPDYEDEAASLSGALSHGKQFHKNVIYIEPQSRLSITESVETEFDYLFLLSGPEPQQSMLAKTLIHFTKEKPELKFAMVSNLYRGENQTNMKFYQSPDAQTLSGIVAASKTIVCRSGYSTLMDLHVLGKKELILIPTTGQTEQEYLAAYWQKKYKAKYCPENRLNASTLFENKE